MRRRLLFTLLVGDLLALGGALLLASWVVFDTSSFWRVQLGTGDSIWPMVAMLGGGAMVASYASLRMWASGVPRASYGRGLAIVTASLLITAVGILLTRSYFSRPFLAVTAGAWLTGALGHRLAWRIRSPWLETMVLVTAEKALATDLDDADHANVVAVYDPAALPPDEPLPEKTMLVVDLRSVLSDPMAQWVSSCNLAGFPVRSLANVYEEHTGRLAMVHLAEGWEVSQPVSRNADYNFLKRGGDLLLTTATAPLWLALGALIWLAIKIDSPGPAIFRQERVGLGGELFTLYKFRTMVADAERLGPRFTTADDDRLTRVGRVLRRFRIDEVPQLVNVLRGDLSLVGPRPEQKEFVDRFSESIPFYGYRHLVRPGVTGWAQVNYGYADDLADTVEKLTFDLYYLKHMSPWLDMRIMGQSTWTVLSGFGAQ
jgi:exopolysaccharide biosynthesis polyprenyl glycosylphosphotransferase